MPFSNALDGFVRGFSVGSEQVRAAQEAQMKHAYYDANAEESKAKAEYYKNKGVADDGVVPGLMTEGRSMYGANAEAPKFAIPATGELYPVEPINEENAKNGLPEGYLRKTAGAESGRNPNASSQVSSAGGLYGFTDATAKQYGLNDRFNPVESTKTAAALAVDNSKALAPVLGRAPNGAELYTAHNQGAPGAKALLANPNANAIAALTPAYKGNAKRARQAIINNGGTPDMTAGEFLQQLQKKYNSQAAIGGGSEFAAHGGVVGQYAEGGEAQKPYYIDDLKNDVSNALGKLGDVVKGGLQGIEEQFGLKNPPAVPTADPKFMQGVEAFQRNSGRAEPEQVEQVKRTVDPDNHLGDALGTTYGMIKSYEYHLSRGDLASANAAASSFLQYTRYKSSQLGALAYHALENGDETAAAKAIEHAFNIIPNAQKIQMKDGKALVIDQRTGDVVRELNFTPKTMMDAATGLVSGETWMQDLESSMKPKEVRVAEINAGSKDNVEQHKDVRQDKALDVKVSEGDKNRDLKASEGDKNRGSREGIAAGHDQTSLTKTQAINTTKTALQDDQQEFKAGESEKDRASREGIAAGHNQTSLTNNQNTNATRRQDTLDTLDAGAVKQANDIEDKNNRLDKRLSSQQGIADKRINSQEKQTGMRTTSSEKIAGQNNETRRDVSSAKNQTDLEKTEMNIGDKQFRQNVNNTFKGEQNDKKIGAQKEISGNKIASQEKIAGDKNETNKQIANDRGVNQRSAAANRAIGVRSGKELDRLNKMTDHEVLGADEAITPKVSSSQAQATRDIARSLVEGGEGKIYGDQGANYARQITAWDAEKKAPKYQISLSQTNEGYVAKMPDGSTIPLSENGYRSIKRIRDMMSGTR